MYSSTLVWGGGGVYIVWVYVGHGVYSAIPLTRGYNRITLVMNDLSQGLCSSSYLNILLLLGYLSWVVSYGEVNGTQDRELNRIATT